MKTILMLLGLFALNLGYSQTWQSIGLPQGTNVSKSDLFIDDQSGRLFLAYVENSTSKATVKEWSGGNWQTVGLPNFGVGAQSQIELAMCNGLLHAAIKYVSGGSDFIQVYQFNGAWNLLYSPGNSVFSGATMEIKSTPDGKVFLHVGGEITQVYPTTGVSISNAPFTSSTAFDFVVDSGLNTWSSFQDNSNFLILSQLNTTTHNWDFVQSLESSMFSYNEIQMNSNSDLIVQVGSLMFGQITLRQLTNGIQNFTSYIPGTSLAFDMDTDNSSTFIYQKSDTSNKVYSVNLSTGTYILIGSNPGGNSGTINNPQIETWNNRVVLTYEENGKMHVKELDNPAVLNLAGNIQVCEQVLYTSSSAYIHISDNNYSQENLNLQVLSGQPSILPSGAINISGTYPDYAISFATSPITSDVSVVLDFSVIENGIVSTTGSTTLLVYDAPQINLSTETFSICYNGSAFDLDTMVTPGGGVWSGPGIVAGNMVEPSFLSPANFDLIYTLSNAHGCVSRDTLDLTILSIPAIIVDNVEISDCNGADGQIEISVTNGLAPYGYQWSNGLQIEDIFGLVAGYYTIVVTDQNNCSSQATISTVSPELDIQGIVQHVLCTGDSNGAIDLNFDPDDLALIESIEWSTGSTSEDIGGLSAGLYEVFVTGINGCVSSAIFEVNSPAAIGIEVFSLNADCSLANGSVSCAVSGGVVPYQYAWTEFGSGSPIGSNSSSVNNLTSGAYQLFLTDANGCLDSANVTISDNSGPVITLDSIFNTGCSNSGAIYLSLSSGAGIGSVLWNDLVNTEDRVGLAAGSYFVEVADILGCLSFENFEIENLPLNAVPICVVTVDSTTNTNLVVWEKPISTEIASFNVYRETSIAGEYVLIGNVPYADETVFNDLVASPSIRSWRYKISAVSNCGFESDLSDNHKTIHLAMSIGIGGSVNLTWNDYEGFTYPQFEIFRYTDSNGWEMIQQMPNNLFSYTDFPPATVNIGYFISIPLAQPCDSLSRAISQNTARSNRTTSIMDITDTTGITEVEMDFEVFPNPSNGLIYVSGVNLKVEEVKVFVTDLSGKQIECKLKMEREIIEMDLTHVNPGVYVISILQDGIYYHHRFVKL